MNANEHLLTTLAEECAEVAKDVSKALRFGVNDTGPGGCMTNEECIVSEIIDVLAMVEMLQEARVITMPSMSEIQRRMDRKKAKVMKFMEYARQQGALDGAA